MSRNFTMPMLGILVWVFSFNICSTSIVSSNIGRREQLLYDVPGTGKHVDQAKTSFLSKITEKKLNDSVSFGENLLKRLGRLETNLGWSNIHVQHGTPAQGQLIDSFADNEALEQGRAALVAAKASQHLMNSHCKKIIINKRQCAKQLTSFKMSLTPLRNICQFVRKDCRPDELQSNYRALDGSCNHLTDHGEGKSFTAYKRLLFPSYLDGIMEPRRAISKKTLPSARFVSGRIIKNIDHPDTQLTLAFMQWSQFIGHDMSHTASSKMISTKKSIVCCDRHGCNLSPRYIHPFCLPISIPSDDSFYSKHRTNCMTYVRSLPAVRSDCSFGPMEQMNQATHYLDASHIYGTSISKANSLREFHDGRLLTSVNQGKVFLPKGVNSEDKNGYKSGDSRVNLQPLLTAMHIFWTREHNRVAQNLAKLNTHWNDEKLYQESRRIVIAQIQHITYNHWLPNVIGTKNADKINAQAKFKNEVDARVSNGFATAAIKFVNSLMDSQLKLYKENRVSNVSMRLQDHFNKPEIVEKSGHLDGLVRGLATQLSQEMDLNLISDITQQLYRSNNYGMDAFSLDIQRGRDHGLPSYVYYRELCGQSAVSNFDDLSEHIPLQSIQLLRQIYGNPSDVDLIVGAMAEESLPDSLLGPTFTCLISEQMQRTRVGDRYFYSYEKQPWSFSSEQLKEIKKSSLARVFCDNSDDIKSMQPNVFSAIGETNILADCHDELIPAMNLDAWKEERNWGF